jgi:hypothetical protein
MHIVSFQKSLLQFHVHAEIANVKTRGDKHSCCATPNVQIATPLGMLSGDVPCSQVQHAHSRTAIGWRSMELVSKLFDTPLYLINSVGVEAVKCCA